MKRKTETQKKVEGTTRTTRKRRPKIVPLKDLPPPQTYLPKSAHKIYYEICRHLNETGQLKKIDSLMVSAAAQSFNYFAQAAKLVNDPKTGLIQKFKNGTRNISPEFSVYKKAAEDLTKYSKLFGLDLKSREGIISFDGKEEKPADPIAKLLNPSFRKAK